MIEFIYYYALISIAFGTIGGIIIRPITKEHEEIFEDFPVFSPVMVMLITSVVWPRIMLYAVVSLFKKPEVEDE